MLRPSHASIFLALTLLASLQACAPRHTAPTPAQPAISLEGWQSETFPLPPDFAPDLPTGTESLRFAPGWRNPDAEGFWSYAFVIWIDEPTPNAARIDTLLEKYYTGLMRAFAGDKDISATPVQVDVRQTAPNHYEAKMHLTDAFATFKPIDINIKIETAAETNQRSSLRIQISRQPKDHGIWRSLQAAIEDILTNTTAIDKE